MFKTFNQYFEDLPHTNVFLLAVAGILIVGVADYLTGYEVSMSVFYLGPIALAAWYAGQWPGIASAVVACICWHFADLASGVKYSHPSIAVWNTFVRFVFFLITLSLLVALRKSIVAVQHLARTDNLTGLYSQRAFDDRIEQCFSLAHRHGSALTLAYLDVDDFKAVNDICGHVEGNKVLQLVGQVLKNSVREVDTAARIGGDEFALIFPDTDEQSAHVVISNINRKLRAALGTSTRNVTCSIGAITVIDLETSIECALEAADKLMYDVKRKGKGAVAFGVLS